MDPARNTAESEAPSNHPLLAREGWPHIAVAGGLLILSLLLAPWWLSALSALLLIFVLQFFRDPPRKSPIDGNLALSPADGHIVFTGKDTDPYLNRDCFKISVFMNVFSVHSNRSPVSGELKDRWYFPGRFVNAALDKASEENERNAVWIQDDNGRDVVAVQVAGLIARRILCYVDKGERVVQGGRYGFIRFGSRVDVYFPAGFLPTVTLGDRVTAGLSVLGRFGP